MSNSILLIEDQEFIRKFIQDSLAQLCLHVLAAATAAEALELANANQGSIKTIISDVNLPDMDGKQLIEQLLRLHPTLPVIWITGDPWSFDPDPGQVVLKKPFNMKDLVSQVREYMAKSE